MACHVAPDQRLFPAADIAAAASAGKLLAIDIALGEHFSNPVFSCANEPGPDRACLDQAELVELVKQACRLGVRKVSILADPNEDLHSTFALLDAISGDPLETEVETAIDQMDQNAAEEFLTRSAKLVLTVDRQLWRSGDVLDRLRKTTEQMLQTGIPRERIAVALEFAPAAISDATTVWTWLREQNLEPRIVGVAPDLGPDEIAEFETDIPRLRELIVELAELDQTRFNRQWINVQPEIGTGCRANLCSCLVNAYGDVFPCRGIDLVVGNVRGHGLGRVLEESEVLESLRDPHSMIVGPCNVCDCRDHCCGCRGLAYQLTLDVVGSEPTCSRNADKESEITYLPMDPCDMLPYAPPMRLIGRLLQIGERVAVTDAEIGRQFPFLTEENLVEEAAYVELIAQTAVAQEAFGSRRGIMTPGILLGANKFSFTGQSRVGDKLTIHVHKEAKMGDFGILLGTITRNGEQIAKGEIKVYRDPEGVTL